MNLFLNKRIFILIFLNILQSFSFNISNVLKNTTTPLNFVEPRIVGGSLATFEHTKHQVSVRLKVSEGYGFGLGHICGGSLISNNTVLTAAHCVYKENNDKISIRKANEFTFVMGTLNLMQRTQNTLQFNAKKLIVHKGFNYKNLKNDIALFYLDGIVPAFHQNVQPIDLTSYVMPDNTPCIITGWGTTRFNGSASSNLLIANISIINQNVCAQSYQNLLHSGMICAGNMNGGVDACQGDSGGPMVCNNVLTGVVSWGNGCGWRNYPGIYSEVRYFNDWIAKGSGTSIFTKKSILINAIVLFTILLY